MLANMCFLFLAFLLSAEVAVGSPVKARSPYAVKDNHHVPARWRKVGLPSADHTINLKIGLKQSQFDELERHLYEADAEILFNQVSDPDHHRYGQYLTEDQVKELVKPTDDTSKLVHEWLLDHNIDSSKISHSAAKDWITIALPVKAVEDLLDTEYSVFEHEGGDRIVRTLEWSLPIHLHDHIVGVQPTNSFFRSAPRSTLARPVKAGNGPPPELPVPPANSTVAAVCNFTAVTPTCLRTLYGTINYAVQAAGENKIALTDYLDELNNRSDISLFLEAYRPEAAAAAYQFEQISIAGGTVQQTPASATQLQLETGVEGALDAQTILGITWPTPMTAYSTGGLDPTWKADNATPTNSDEPYLVWLDYILSVPDSELPQTISTSYGDDEQTVSYSYAVQACNGFAQLGARGVSLLFASGDYGVGASGYCYSNDGLGTPEFLPSFPCSCPFVTNVGATTGYPEVAAYDPRFKIPFTSGAGFSNYFPRPKYQAKVVDPYIASLHGEHDGLYNKSGRAYPDIAAQGQYFAVYWTASEQLVDGTSAATPTASSIISLVNDALIAAGRPPLGFLNPWLYTYGYKAFTDITSGSSAGCTTAGFPAKIGWDAVTGFGTPYFPAILDLLGLECPNH